MVLALVVAIIIISRKIGHSQHHKDLGNLYQMEQSYNVKSAPHADSNKFWEDASKADYYTSPTTTSTTDTSTSRSSKETFIDNSNSGNINHKLDVKIDAETVLRLISSLNGRLLQSLAWASNAPLHLSLIHI